jgi:hypothetical protein
VAVLKMSGQPRTLTNALAQSCKSAIHANA